MFALLAYFIISHVVSFICSLLEATLLSCTQTYVSILKKQGSKAAPTLEALKSRIDRPLAAILTLNTMAHTFGAAGVGAKVVQLYGSEWLALSSVIITLTMLYWTEMIPKTLGAFYWKKLIIPFAVPIKVLIVITYPFVFSFDFFVRLLARGKKTDKITEEEIRVALDAGTQAGVIQEAEQDMVENIFRLGDRRVSMLMLPRVDIQWLDVNDSVEKIREKIITTGIDHFPICEGDIDRVIGMVDLRTLLSHALAESPLDMREIAQPPLFVQENQRIFELIDLLKRSHANMALVNDEYGSMQGMITINDVLNAIVKDIEAKKAGERGEIIKINNRSYLVDGRLPIDEFKEMFHFDTLPEEERARFRTVSGLCMSQLDAIPKKGDTFNLNSLRFEVLKVHHHRVEKVLITDQEHFS